MVCVLLNYFLLWSADFGGNGEDVLVVEVQEYIGDPAYGTATTQLHKVLDTQHTCIYNHRPTLSTCCAYFIWQQTYTYIIYVCMVDVVCGTISLSPSVTDPGRAWSIIL